LPLIGRGLKIRSTGICGNLTLRLLAQFRSLRPGSLRYHEEQLAIEDWLAAMKVALEQDSAFAGALAELPRLLKGYGDTHARGRDAYRTVMDSLVRPAIATGAESQAAPLLRRAIATACADADADLSQLVCQPDADSVLGRGSAAAEPA
jgi:indolepyruvate ferredoxin oxidoreductase beta subunit